MNGFWSLEIRTKQYVRSKEKPYSGEYQYTIQGYSCIGRPVITYPHNEHERFVRIDMGNRIMLLDQGTVDSVTAREVSAR